MWHLQLFGTIRATYYEADDEANPTPAITIPSMPDKPSLLMGYLAWKGKMEYRQYLAPLLWAAPEDQDDIGETGRALDQQSLSQALTLIKQRFTTENPPRKRFTTLFQVTKEKVGLVPDTYTTDFCEFHRHLKRGRFLENREEKIFSYKKAISHYRGDFLPSRYALGWLVYARVQFRREYLDALVTLASLEEEAGRYETAYHYLFCALQEEPTVHELLQKLERVRGKMGLPTLRIAEMEPVRWDNLQVDQEKEIAWRRLTEALKCRNIGKVSAEKENSAPGSFPVTKRTGR